MRPSKHLSVKVLGTILVVLLWSGTVFAGASPEPVPPGSTITGPEIWGVVVIDCASGNGTIRVKRVVDCNTDTATKAGPWPVTTGTCPTKVADVEGFSLPAGTSFFVPPIAGTAFVNKAKNFKNEGNIVSFDAQFKFWLP
jgi:hypothetical protein